MTGEELRAAREALGFAWGKGRPLTMLEMGRACGLKGGGNGIRDYERGKTVIRGPLAILVSLYLRGEVPPEGIPSNDP